MKAKIIAIINKHINDLILKEEQAKHDQDIIRMGHYRLAKMLLREIVKEIQDQV